MLVLSKSDAKVGVILDTTKRFGEKFAEKAKKVLLRGRNRGFARIVEAFAGCLWGVCGV